MIETDLATPENVRYRRCAHRIESFLGNGSLAQAAKFSQMLCARRFFQEWPKTPSFR